MLKGLEGKTAGLRPRRVGDGRTNVTYLQDQWTTMREEASSNIERCGDAQLQRELDALEFEMG